MTAKELAALVTARRAGPGKWQAKCPGHKDRNPSLSIAEGRDGRTLLNCHAGCRVEAILAAMGLQMSDLYLEAPARKERKSEVRHYEYQDANGSVLYRVTRSPDKQFRQSRPDGRGGWIWNLVGVTRVPYRLPELLQADLVMIAEGEKDADRLAGLHLENYPAFKGRGVAATTNSGGAGKWHPSYSELLRGKDVLVFEDNDEPGRKHAQTVFESVEPFASGVKLIRLPGLSEHGDVSDWLQEHSASELIAEIQRAAQWHPESNGAVAVAKVESESNHLQGSKVEAIPQDVPARDPTTGKMDILTAALETVGVCLSKRESFHALCVALQRLRGNEPVVLPVERIAAGFGCHWSLIARLRRQAVIDGWLKPERPAIAHRQAGRFYVLSKTSAPLSRNKENVMEEIPQPRNPSHSHFSDTPEPEPLVRHPSDTPACEDCKTVGGYEVIDI